jgi:hypothetical protein
VRAILHVRVNVASERPRKMCVRSIITEWERGREHTWQLRAIGWSAKRCYRLGIEGHNPWIESKTRTKVVYEHRRAFDERKHRVLLQLHILRNLSRVILLRAQCQNGRGSTHCRFCYARHECPGKLKVVNALRDGVLLSLGGCQGVRVVLSWHWQAANRSRLPGPVTAFSCKMR